MRVIWTLQMITKARRLAEQGLSGNQIANDLGITRSAAIAKLSREGIKLKGLSRGGRKPGAPRNFREMPTGKHRIKATLKPEIREALPNNVTLEQLTHDACRWPIGEASSTQGFLYCGKRREHTNLPYCPEHCRMAYRSEEPRR